MSIMCQKDCKEGIPIPFIGFVCVGLSDVCSPFGIVCEAVSIISRGDVCLNSEIEEQTKPRVNTFKNKRDSAK